MADMFIENLGESDGTKFALRRKRVRKMTVMVIGATLLVSFATAFVMQKMVLGAMLRVFERDKEDTAARRA